MAGVCAKAAGHRLWERTLGALSIKGDYDPSFQTVLCDLVWGKGSAFLALEALCVGTLLREPLACPLPAPNAPHVGSDRACRRLTMVTECLLHSSHCAKPFTHIISFNPLRQMLLGPVYELGEGMGAWWLSRLDIQLLISARALISES